MTDDVLHLQCGHTWRNREQAVAMDADYGDGIWHCPYCNKKVEEGAPRSDVLLELECGHTFKKTPMDISDDGRWTCQRCNYARRLVVARWEKRVPVEQEYKRPVEVVERLRGEHLVRAGTSVTVDANELQLVLDYYERLEDVAKATAFLEKADIRGEYKFSFDEIRKARKRAGWK